MKTFFIPSSLYGVLLIILLFKKLPDWISKCVKNLEVEHIQTDGQVFGRNVTFGPKGLKLQYKVFSNAKS